MRLTDIVVMAIDGVKERKFRVALNVLGILIGITALTALVSITEGMSMAVNQQMEFLSPTAIVVSPGGGFGLVSGRTLTLRDVDQIKRMPNVAVATPVVGSMAEVQIGGYTGAAMVLGVIPDEYLKVIKSAKVAEGRFLGRSDSVSVVVGAHIAHPPYREEPIASVGSRVTVVVNRKGVEEKVKLRVAGILKEVGGGGIISPDEHILVTLRTAQKIFGSGNEVDHILIDVKNVEAVDDVVKEVQDKLGEGVTVISLGSIRETVGRINSLLEAVLGGVAAISLIVAGLGIINTMTISVMERTREIGVMKAVGAKNRHILLMFLMEALLTGLVGGIAGVILGFFTGQIASSVITYTVGMTLPSVFSLKIGIVGVGFAVVTGVLAGLYPARRASKLPPVEALRYE